jgi:golgi phosphoprotein 3
MSSGLQRRRVGGGDSALTPSSSRPDLSNNSFSGRSSPAVSPSTEGMNAIEQQSSDHRIAFDPRDMAEGEERLKFPKLTLMEEVLLLGLKDKQVILLWRGSNQRDISYTLRGCILLELAFRSRISMQKDSSRRRFELADRLIEVIDDRLTGEVLLDEALKMMKSSEKMSVGSWIDLMSGTTHPFKPLSYCER